MNLTPTAHSTIKAYEIKQGIRYLVRLRIDHKLRGGEPSASISKQKPFGFKSGIKTLPGG